MSKKRQEAAALVKQARALEAKAEKENRKLSSEETEQFDAFMSDAREKLDEAKREESLEQMDAELSAELLENDGNPAGQAAQTAGQAAQTAGTERTEVGETSVVVPDPTVGSERLKAPAQARDREAEGRYGFDYFGQFAHIVAMACDPTTRFVDPRLEKMMAATGGSQGVLSDGGFLVPPTFGTAIWDGLRQDPLDLVSRTDQFTVVGDSISFPANAETSRVGGTVYGGVTANWLAEAGAIAATKPTFRKLKLEPQELAVLIYETDKLIRNSPIALEQFLQRAAADAIGFKIGDAIIRGDGSGKPLGLLNSSGLITIAKESAQLADTIVFENIAKMHARMHGRRRPNSVWLHNQDIEPQLQGLVDPSNNVPVFLPPGGVSAAPFSTLYGKPLIPVEHMSTLGDVGDLMLVDLSAYATGMRAGPGAGIRTAVSIHLRFDFAETAFRFMMEIDGQPWLNTPLTPAQGTNTLSTHVVLAARA